jgi:dynein heavy chain 1
VRNLYQLPSDWVSYKSVKSEWSEFSSLVATKSDILESQVSKLQERLTEQITAFNLKVQKLRADWTSGRPLEGDIDYEAALGALTLFNGRVQRLSEEWRKVVTVVAKTTNF